MNLRVHRILTETEAEGPGKRLCLWVQGCHRRCQGCFNQETWDLNAGRLYDTEQILDMALDAPGLEGVTFVGGEPLLQARALAELGAKCQMNGLSVLTFTGYAWAEIRKADDADWNALLEVTDLLLAGPYIAAQQDFSRPWVGSANQEFIFLSSRYTHLQETISTIHNQLELRIDPDGSFALNGLASDLLIEDMRQQLAAWGLVTHT